MGVACSDRGLHLFGRRVVDVVMAQLQHRRRVTPAHARRAEHPNLGRVEAILQRLLQSFGACHFARKRVAYADGQGGWRCLAFGNDIEVRIEGGNFIDLGLRQSHFVRERGKVVCREVTVFVLNEVQEFDQQIAAAGLVAQKGANLLQRAIVDLASFRRDAGFPRALLLPDTLLIVEWGHVRLPAFVRKCHQRNVSSIFDYRYINKYRLL